MVLPTEISNIRSIPSFISVKAHKNLLYENAMTLFSAILAIIVLKGWLLALELLFGPLFWLVNCWFRLLIIAVSTKIQYQMYAGKARNSGNMMHDWVAGAISLYFIEEVVSAMW
jgi:hypothetical protein